MEAVLGPAPGWEGRSMVIRLLLWAGARPQWVKSRGVNCLQLGLYGPG